MENKKIALGMTKKTYENNIIAWDYLLILGLAYNDRLRNEYFKREYGVEYKDAHKSDEELIAMGYKEKEIK